MSGRRASAGSQPSQRLERGEGLDPVARILVTGNRRHFVPLLRRGLRVLTAEEFVAELAESANR